MANDDEQKQLLQYLQNKIYYIYNRLPRIRVSRNLAVSEIFGVEYITHSVYIVVNLIFLVVPNFVNRTSIMHASQRDVQSLLV